MVRPNHEQVWSRQFPQPASVDDPSPTVTDPVFYNNTVMLLFNDGTVYCLAAGAGDIVWTGLSQSFPSAIVSSPTVDTVYGSVVVGLCSADAIGVYAMDLVTGKTLWMTPTAVRVNIKGV